MNENKIKVNKSENNILRQKIKRMMERAKTYGFVTESRPEFYQKTELFKKYLEDGEKFSIDDDEAMLKFLLDNHELFLKLFVKKNSSKLMSK